MATELGKAFVQIVPSARGIKNSISKELGGEAESSGKSAGGKIAGAIKKMIAGAGIGTAIKKALSEGAELEQSIGGIETLYKENADIMKKYAAEAYKTAGMSANEYMQNVTSFSASLLQGLGGDTAKAAEVADMAMRDMSDNWNKFGSDAASVQNAYQGFAKQNYTMLDNLKLGYGGTRSEMQRLLADAQKVTGVKYDINNLSDVYEAIHVIQGEIGVTGTTAKEAASTFSGSLASMKAAGKNLLGNLALGEDITPALESLVDTTVTFVTKNLLPMLGKVLSGIPKVVMGAIKGIGNNMGDVLNVGIEIINGIIEGISSSALDMRWAFGSLLFKVGEFISSFDWGTAVTDLLTNLVSSLQAFAGGGYLVEAGLSIISAIGEALLEAIPALIECLPDLLMGILTGIQERSMILLEAGLPLISSISEGLLANLPTLITALGDMLMQALESLFQFLPQFMEKGIEIIMNLAQGIMQNLPAIIAAITQVISSLIGYIMDNLPEFISKGIELIFNLAQGILENLPAIITAITTAIFELLTQLVTHLPEFLQKGVELIGQLAAGIIKAVPQILKAAVSLITSLVSNLKSFGSKFVSIGKDLLLGLGKGIVNAVSSVIKSAKEACGKIVSKIKGFFGIHSPSRLFAGFGEMLDAGLALGISENTKPITDAISEVNKLTAGNLETEFALSSVAGRKATPGDNGNDISAWGGITIIVNGAPGQDVNDLADAVSARLEHLFRKREASLA